MAPKDRKVLGTGLSALFGDLSPGTDEMTTLPLSRIEPREDQPRDVFEEDSLQSLADSISRYGLLQPITVRYQDSGYYQIIAGERRWRAARLAGLTEVPVRIIEADDRTTAELALVENLQREDLNPIEEARGYQSLIDDFGLTQEEAAKSVGKSRPAVANALRLLSLSPDVLYLVPDERVEIETLVDTRLLTIDRTHHRETMRSLRGRYLIDVGLLFDACRHQQSVVVYILRC